MEIRHFSWWGLTKWPSVIDRSQPLQVPLAVKNRSIAMKVLISSGKGCAFKALLLLPAEILHWYWWFNHLQHPLCILIGSYIVKRNDASTWGWSHSRQCLYFFSQKRLLLLQAPGSVRFKPIFVVSGPDNSRHYSWTIQRKTCQVPVTISLYFF